MTYQNPVGSFKAAARRARYEVQPLPTPEQRVEEDEEDEKYDTPLAERLKNIPKTGGLGSSVFEVPADTATTSSRLLTVTDERLNLMSKHSERMDWPPDLLAQVPPNGKGGPTKKELLRKLFDEYNGPSGRRHVHAVGDEYTAETFWLVDGKGRESRHMVVAHQDGAVTSALFGDARSDPKLLTKMHKKASHQNAAPEVTGAFSRGITSLHGKKEMESVRQLVSGTPPLRSFRSPEDYVLEERRDQAEYVATIYRADGKIVRVERYVQPKSDEQLLKHMNKSFSQSRAATGAPSESSKALQEGWVKNLQAPMAVKQEPQEWSTEGVHGYLFDADGRPLSREELRIDEATPIGIDTCGMADEKAAEYRQQLRTQMNGMLQAWEQGQLPQLYDVIGVHVVTKASHGCGVRATKDIKAGTLIGLYGGKVFDVETWESSYRTQQERDLYGNYVLEPSDKGLYIDPREQMFRNPMGFLNHPSSKTPCNLKQLKCGPLVVGFVTRRDVGCGEELTFSYGLNPHLTGTSRKPHELNEAD